MLANRNPGIDMLRGLSILFVILLHCRIHMPVPENFLPPSLTKILFWSGYYGVMIFFVISGFLITSTSLKRWGSLTFIPPLSFYRMRFARIMPALLLLLGILALFHQLAFPGFRITTTSLSQALFAASTFHLNWLEAKTGYLPGNWDVLWSLSVEEVFYLLFPLACLTLRKPMAIITFLGLFIILGPFARTSWSTNDYWLDHSYFSCMDGIAMGCLAALFAHYFKLNKFLQQSFTAIGYLLFLSVLIFRKEVAILGLPKWGLNVTLLELGIALLLITMQQNNFTTYYQNLLLAPIRWFGRYSYEAYLIHMFFVTALTQFLFDTKFSSSHIILLYGMVLIATLATSHFFSIYFTEPLNAYLRRKKIVILEPAKG